MILSGKCSWFGGPNDTGVGPHEGLALIHSVRQLPEVFLPEGAQDPFGRVSGLARRLDPSKMYIACRWDYHHFPISYLLGITVTVECLHTGITVGGVHPVDWGPNAKTGRVADLSPGLMKALGLETDGNVIVRIPDRNV